VKRKYRSSPARSHPVRLFVSLASYFGFVPLVPPVLGVVIVITLLMSVPPNSPNAPSITASNPARRISRSYAE
jgi:hypothetical protein